MWTFYKKSLLEKKYRIKKKKIKAQKGDFFRRAMWSEGYLFVQVQTEIKNYGKNFAKIEQKLWMRNEKSFSVKELNFICVFSVNLLHVHCVPYTIYWTKYRKCEFCLVYFLTEFYVLRKKKIMKNKKVSQKKEKEKKLFQIICDFVSESEFYFDHKRNWLMCSVCMCGLVRKMETAILLANFVPCCILKAFVGIKLDKKSEEENFPIGFVSQKWITNEILQTFYDNNGSLHFLLRSLFQSHVFFG